ATVNGGFAGAQLTTSDCQEPFTAAELAALNPGTLRGVGYDRQIGSLGEFRLMAMNDFNGNPVVLGLSYTSVNTTVMAFAVIAAGVGAAALIAATFVGAAIVRRTLRPLRRVADTASRVAELELDRGDVALSVRVPEAYTDPHTEVGQVGAALNRMLGHVAAALTARQASEMRVRQFVADASHELRTPLAAIRGYAELTRRSHDEVPPNVAHAIRRVESESARMTGLVNDLLLLARLDSGRPLARDQVDLSRLVLDAVSDAHIAGPGHAWRLDLPPDPVVVNGDQQRLHQVLANLLSNARTHTPSGTTVTTGLAEHNGQMVLTVTDDGPGIPADLLPEAFERFARGDTSRSRNAGSTGLGLAIVAAVVGAHRGSVGVTSEPGKTVFTVTLPR
ncbi:MAG TPA: ATP-binding protein, partial [Pseudonocardiaceae bacterium]